MIQSIENYYHSPNSCPYLCVPLKKYQELFVEKREELEGCSKIALTVAWLATAIFAYPIFGLLALIGAGLSFATSASLERPSALPDQGNMTPVERSIWKRVATVEEWNEAQIANMGREEVSPSSRQAVVDYCQDIAALLEWPDYLHHDSYKYANCAVDSVNALKERISTQVREYTKQNIKIDISHKRVLHTGVESLDAELAAEKVELYFILSKSLEEEPIPAPLDMTPGELQIWKKIATVAEWNQAQIARIDRYGDDEDAIPYPRKTHLEEGEEASLIKNCLYFERIDFTNQHNLEACDARFREKAVSFTEYKIDIELLFIQPVQGHEKDTKVFLFIRKSS